MKLVDKKLVELNLVKLNLVKKKLVKMIVTHSRFSKAHIEWSRFHSDY